MFDFMSKMIKGEPVFDATSSDEKSTSQQSHTSDPTRTESGHKVHPEVRITNLKTSRNGDRMEVYAYIRNESPFEIEVRRVRLMNQTSPLRVVISAGGTSRNQVKIYSGKIPYDDNENDAHLDFCITSNGDYFQQEFDVEFDRQSDGAYLIEELHAEDHVRDT